METGIRAEQSEEEEEGEEVWGEVEGWRAHREQIIGKIFAEGKGVRKPRGAAHSETSTRAPRVRLRPEHCTAWGKGGVVSGWDGRTWEMAAGFLHLQIW